MKRFLLLSTCFLLFFSLSVGGRTGFFERQFTRFLGNHEQLDSVKVFPPSYLPLIRVDYLNGATNVTVENSQDGDQGATLGNFINADIKDEIQGDFQTYVTSHPLYMHEYGHTIDSRKWGPLYLLGVGLPSAISASQNIDISNPQYPDAFIGSHDLKPYEKAANRNAKDYFGRHYDVDWSKHEPHYPL